MTGTAAILAAAGPLSAHIVDGNELVFDGAQARYGPDGTDVYVEVDQVVPPGVLSITLTTTDQTGDANQAYTLMPGDVGHTFIFPKFAVNDINEIDLSLNASGRTGTCQVAPGS